MSQHHLDDSVLLCHLCGVAMSSSGSRCTLSDHNVRHAGGDGWSWCRQRAWPGKTDKNRPVEDDEMEDGLAFCGLVLQRGPALDQIVDQVLLVRARREMQRQLSIVTAPAPHSAQIPQT
eukprot:3583720-Rhodomonas_salina.8